MRSQREISFYGDMDFIPAKSYTLEDAEKAMDSVRRFLAVADKVIEEDDE